MNKTTAKDYMNKPCHLCYQDSSIRDLADLGVFSNQYSYVIDRQGSLVGRIDFNCMLELYSPNLLFSTQKNKMLLSGKLGNLKIGEIMDKSLRVIFSDCPFSEILEIILSGNNEILPVIDKDGLLIGELSAGSILDNVINSSKSIEVFGREMISGAAI